MASSRDVCSHGMRSYDDTALGRHEDCTRTEEREAGREREGATLVLIALNVIEMCNYDALKTPRPKKRLPPQQK